MASMGFDGKIAIGETVMQASNINIGKRGLILERNGLRGTREHNVLDTRDGPYRVQGGFSCEPSPVELATLLAWAIDGTAATVTKDVVAGQYEYADVKVNTLRLSGSSGGLLTCTVDCVGTTEDDGEALDDPASGHPIAFSPDVALSLASAARDVQSFELVIDNQIDTERFFNSLTLTEVNPQDQVDTLRATVPFDADHLELYDQAVAGAAGTLTLTQDGYTPLIISFGTLQVPAESPEVGGKGEIFLNLNMQARASGASAAISVSGGTGS